MTPAPRAPETVSPSPASSLSRRPLRRPPTLASSLAAGSASNTWLGLHPVMPHLLQGRRISHGYAGLPVTVLPLPHAILQAITGWAAEAVGMQRPLRRPLAAVTVSAVPPIPLVLPVPVNATGRVARVGV